MPLTPEMIDRAERYLFASDKELSEARLPMPVRKRLVRMRGLYTWRLEHPQLTDAQTAAEYSRRHKLTLKSAYDDLRLVKVLIGNIAKASADWYRWLFVQRAEEAFQMARDKEDAKAFAQTLAALGKYTRLDAPEGSAPDYSQIVPQPFEISADPEVAGFKRIPDLERKVAAMLRRFRQPEPITVEAETVSPTETKAAKAEAAPPVEPQGGGIL